MIHSIDNVTVTEAEEGAQPPEDTVDTEIIAEATGSSSQEATEVPQPTQSSQLVTGNDASADVTMDSSIETHNENLNETARSENQLQYRKVSSTD